ncbi:MAG: hypothetical protein Q7V19_07150, partial [Bacteroidales bacterium]|nr:hypothetical protein [Bacteroidales bacterium]
KSLKYIGIILLTAVYCMAISFVVKPVSLTKFIPSSNSDPASYISGISVSLFCHTAQSESSPQTLNNLLAPGFNNLFSQLWAIVIATEKLLVSEFLQYTRFSTNIQTYFGNVDIIFPFHNFW